MTAVLRTQHNINQRRGRLDREIIYYSNRITSIGTPDSPTKKRAMTLAVKCLKRSVRDLDKLKTLPFIEKKK